MSQSRQTSLAGANDAVPSAVLTDRESGGTVELPVLEGTMGPPVIDIRALYAGTGKFSYDPGFTATGSCKSRITYIDGEQGVLLHRGYPINELAEQSDFLEVSYLLLHGELPNAAEKDRFVSTITKHTMVHEQINYLYRGFRRDSHPMAVMIGVVGALAAFYHDTTDIDDPKQRMIASHRLIAKMPTFAAMAYKYSIGQPFVYPRNDLTYAENFLHMMFAVPCEDYQINPIHARAMDRLLILHADHEQNASTSTVRLAGSSGANPYACIAAGIATLWGPAHGGANEAVLQMLEEIGTVDNISDFIGRAKNKDDAFRLMGFGHRVYKNYDPRATVMRETCHRGARRPRHQRRAAQDRHGAGADRAGGSVFRRAQALPQRRFLLRPDPAGARHPDPPLHGDLCAGAHRRLGRPVERDDRRSRAEDRPAAPALHRPGPAQLRPLEGTAVARRLRDWRPQGDSNPRFRRERPVS